MTTKKEIKEWEQQSIKNKHRFGMIMVIGGKVYSSGCSGKITRKDRHKFKALLRAALRTFDRELPGSADPKNPYNSESYARKIADLYDKGRYPTTPPGDWPQHFIDKIEQYREIKYKADYTGSQQFKPGLWLKEQIKKDKENGQEDKKG